jgi:hypothetical protein
VLLKLNALFQNGDVDHSVRVRVEVARQKIVSIQYALSLLNLNINYSLSRVKICS